MRNNFGRDKQYRTLCCHVKSATLAWGFLNLILQLIVLASFAMIVINPHYTDNYAKDITESFKLKYKSEPLPSLFTIDRENVDFGFSNIKPTLRTQYFTFKVKDFNIEDAHIGLVVTICALMLTSLLIHGVLSGKPGYLIPFFSLQIFDLCLTVLTFLGFYTYSPSLEKYLSSDNSTLWMNSNDPESRKFLGIATFLVFVSIVGFKLYFVHVVWTCYKYLCNRKQSLKINYIKVEPETASLPDYETAVKMPPTEFIIPPPTTIVQ